MPQRRGFDPSLMDRDLAEWPFYNLARLIGLYHHRMDAALKPIGLDVTRWRVLNILQKHGHANVTQIAAEAVAKISTMTKTIQRMVGQGLVATRPSPDDARSIEVFLTDEGARMLTLARDKAGRIAWQAFQNISDEEIMILNMIVRKSYGNLE